MSEPYPNNIPTPHCNTCKAQSCKGRNVVATSVMYNNIIEAGHPDHFHAVEIPEGKFYVLDHFFNPDGQHNNKQTCHYLQDNQCSLGADKPGTCAVWPATRSINKFGEFKGIAIANSCDEEKAKAATPEFMERATFLIEMMNQNMPVNVTQKVIDQHRANLHQKLNAKPATS